MRFWQKFPFRLDKSRLPQMLVGLLALGYALLFTSAEAGS